MKILAMRLPLQLILILAAVLLQANVSAAAEQAPDLRLYTDQGDFDLSSLRGKVVYLDFWASWCKPCLKSFPWMREMKQAYADKGLEVVAVSVDSDREAADEFLRELGIDVNFIIAYDERGMAASLYELRGMPSTYLLGRDGRIYASHVGFRERDKQELEDVLNKLLHMQPGTL